VVRRSHPKRWKPGKPRLGQVLPEPPKSKSTSTIINCDHCKKNLPDLSRRIQLTNFCTPSGIMISRDLDFCGNDCFWEWVAQWKRITTPKDKP
jgi:hypothetical protein